MSQKNRKFGKNFYQTFLVVKNFGNNFYYGNYGYQNFPEGVWKEVFNSDLAEYNGSNLINSDRDSISQNAQGLNLAANSICILKRVS